MFDSYIDIKGKHATYAKFLCNTSAKKDIERRIADVFDRIIDVYLVAPVIGLTYGLKREEDLSTADEARIFAEQVVKEKSNLEFLFRMVMLVDNSKKLSSDEKISRAFKKDDEETNLQIFNAYVRGGIEWLYEQFTDGATTRDEYIAKINEIVSTYQQEHNC